MKIGYAEIDITPPLGAIMAAFPLKQMVPRRVAGIHDQLKVKVLVLENGGQRLAVCSGDLTFWETSDVCEIRQRAAAVCPGISPENIMLCCTHTHHSGENTYKFGGRPDDAWVLELKEKTVCAIKTAFSRLKDTRVFFNQIVAPYNHNRRVRRDGKISMAFVKGPDTVGPTDPTLSLLKFVADDGRNVIWLNWTGHALTVGPKNRLVTADYPGVLCRLIEQENADGCHLFFTNGCAGNIHPCISMTADFKAAEEIAGMLAAKALSALSEAVPLAEDEFSIKTETLELPHRKHPEIMVKILLSCVHLGNVRIGFLPGEPFVEFQLRYRQELAPHPVFINGYSNGGIGYLPTATAFTEGGYGVDYFNDPDPEIGRTQIGPGDGETIIEHLIKLSQKG